MAGGNGSQRDAPEEERRLVELRLIPHSSGKPEPVAKRVLREEGLARLVGNPDGATAHRHGADDCRCAQQRHEQHALPSRQPSRVVNRHADISHPRGKWRGSSLLDVVETTVPSGACARQRWRDTESWRPYWHRGWIFARRKGRSGVAAAPSPSLATDEVEVPQVYENARRFPEDEHGVQAMDRIGEQRQPTTEGEEPERHGKHALLASLGGDPLDDEARGKEGLRQQPDRQPEPLGAQRL